MPSHMERTLEVLKGQDFLLQVVEVWNAYTGTRKDLFSIFDILAVHPAHGTIGVQVCGKDFSSHVEKMTVTHKEALILWLLGDNRAVLIGWRKLKPRKTATTAEGRAGGWIPRTVEFNLRDLGVTAEAEAALRGMVNPDCPDWIRTPLPK